jgi:hypothetical protein
MSNSGAIPLLGKVRKFSIFVVFWYSLVSTGMKAQTPKWIGYVDLSRDWNFQQYPLTSRNDYSSTIWWKRVCKYSLERYQRYLQLLYKALFLNLYHLRSAASFITTAHSGQIPSKRVKRNWNMCRLKFSPNLKRSWVILLLWPTCSCSLVQEK